jgi:hypothetical protein
MLMLMFWVWRRVYLQVEVNFGEIYCLQLQGISPKRWYLPENLFGAKTQDIIIIISICNVRLVFRIREFRLTALTWLLPIHHSSVFLVKLIINRLKP